ncbi:MAG TPA: winged helix-turn-helix domain-containing protein [Candidatus Limnocylindria bacterium]|nr:winged helix-turn-helix domain-containing protein [Candidatus Limnocylindria bacterium]
MPTAIDAAPLALIAGADPAGAAALRAALGAQGIRSVACRTADVALAGIDFHRPTITLVQPSAEDGVWSVVRAARAAGSLAVVVNASGDAVTSSLADAAGVDDTILDASPEHVAARVAALVRRSAGRASSASVLRQRDLLLDIGAHEVRVAGRRVPVTARQFALLRALLEARGATLTREQLAARITGADDELPSDAAIELHVSRLRRRLGDTHTAPRYIEAVYGVGYRAAPVGSDAPPVSEGEAARVLDALPDAVLVLDDALRVRSANRAAELLLDRTRDELDGAVCSALLDCRDQDGRAIGTARCLGRVVLGGACDARDVRAVVRVPEGHLPVKFSHVRVDLPDGTRRLAITFRPEGPADNGRTI